MLFPTLVANVVWSFQFDSKKQIPGNLRDFNPYDALGNKVGTVCCRSNRKCISRPFYFPSEGNGRTFASGAGAHQYGSASFMSSATVVAATVVSALGALPTRSNAGVFTQPTRSSRCSNPPMRSLMTG
jgi:hypothetical protein